MSFKIYQVGGSVRDELMSYTTKDYDFVVCLDDVRNKTVDQGWEEMNRYLKESGYKVFLETKDAYTIRAKFPDGHKHQGMVADFVMARKDIGYNQGVDRKPTVALGTLYDDLERRDFTVNAIAKDEDGKLIDFFEGRIHLKDRMLYTPLDPNITLLDDPLRVLRAMRFVITKDLEMSLPLIKAMRNPLLGDYFKVISDERIREELYKCFKFSTINTLTALQTLKNLNSGIYSNIFSREIWLKPTNEK